jgi:hypothetical protein
MHLGQDRWLTCGKHAKGESIAQKSGRPQEGGAVAWDGRRPPDTGTDTIQRLHPTGNGPPDDGTDTDTIRGHGTQNQIDGVRNFPFGSTR